MSIPSLAIKNVTATWLGLAVHALVGFFLSPFILHRLGDNAFSVWILVFALTGYFGLLDFGIRSAVVKYTAKLSALHDSDQLSRNLSTSLAFYGFIAIVVILMTAIGAAYLHLFFKIPPGLIHTARILFLLSGVSVAFAFPLTVFAGVLEGLQKFSSLQLSQIGVSLLRAVVIVIALMCGGGLLTIGIITVATSLLSYLIFMWMAMRVLPTRLQWANVDLRTFRTMVGYGLFAFAILAAEKLRFQCDAAVIGALLSASAITMFSIGSKLVEYSSYAVRGMSQVFTPMSSHFHAAGDLDRLRRTFTTGNRVCALITFPLCVILVILGKPIIVAWVGVRYLSSYYVLVLLMVPRSLYLAQSTSTRILMGMGRHRTLATVLVLEGIANLVLSIFLAHPFGILGVAAGTAVPLICTSLFFLPQHLCRVLNVPLFSYLRRAYVLPLVLCVPMAGALWFVGRQFPADNFPRLLLQIAFGGSVYALGLGIALLKGGLPQTRTLQAFAQLLEPK
jgi:O-antigen/teichoic acid export membrane protein